MKVLLVEDEFYFRSAVKSLFSEKDEVFEAQSYRESIEFLDRDHFDLVIIDMVLDSEHTGLDILTRAKKKNLFSIMLTDYEDSELVYAAYEKGLDHFLAKDDFDLILPQIIKERRLDLGEKNKFNLFFQEDFITQSSMLKAEICSLAKRLGSDRSVLILGETGVGKGVLAQFIHRLNNSGDKNFVPLNLAAISEPLVESELFGHVKGSFSGAFENYIGKLSQAHGGTLFLDEVASIPLNMQVKLLKTLEEKYFYRVGGNEKIHSHFRVVTASCEDIYGKIREEKFRADLFQRINSIIIKIPPLRDRPEDIPLLLEYFQKQFSRKVHITPEALEIIKIYPWPGNIRELKSFAEDLFLGNKGIIGIKEVQNCLGTQKNDLHSIGSFLTPELSWEQLISHFRRYIEKNGLGELFEKLEWEILKNADRKFEGKASLISKYLKLPLSTYHRRFKNLKDKFK